jgi:1-phosphofructokinase family hexose kinase
VILAAGLSPAWQQIVVLDALSVGEVNRAREVRWCASGKVLNAGLALHCLATSPPLSKGGQGESLQGEIENCKLKNENCKLESAEEPAARTLALVGGFTGEAIRREFAELGVSSRWLTSQTPTRVCTTILDREAGSTTELVENAGTISPAELDEFKSAYFEEAARAEFVVLTGSLPTGVPATFYRELLEKTPGRVVLDAQGEPLLAALECRPLIVKPNREELGRTLGRRIESGGDLHSAMRELCRRGAHWVAVSQGRERVWLASERELLSVSPPQVSVVNVIGSGDCLAAGIAVGLAGGDDVPESILYGIAAAAENVGQLFPARLDPVRVRTLREKLASAR